MDSFEEIRILGRFRSQRVLVVGDVMLDRYLWGTVTRVSPEAPVPIVASQRTSFSPGGAANVAVSIATLGGHPILASAAGADQAGQDLHAALAERGVSPAEVVRSSRRRTTVKTRIMAHNQQLLRIDEERTDSIDSELTEELLARIEDLLPSVNVVVLSDYAKGVLTPPFISAVIDRASRLGLPVLVDPKGHDYARYNGASVLTPNRSEAFLASGLPQDRGATVADAGAHLMNSLRIGALLITEGESGMTLFEGRDSVLHVTALARVVYDVTGAGDVVIATMGLALAAGASLRLATYLANLAGGLAVEQVGTATITTTAIEYVLQDKHQSLPTLSDVRIAESIQ